MSTRTVTFDCPGCLIQFEVECEVTSWGHPGTPPSFSYAGDPPEGPEFEYTFPERCPTEDENCMYKSENYPADLEEKFDEKALEYISENPPEPDYGEDRYDDWDID